MSLRGGSLLFRLVGQVIGGDKGRGSRHGPWPGLPKASPARPHEPRGWHEGAGLAGKFTASLGVLAKPRQAMRGA